MTVKSYPFKTGLIALILFLCHFAPVKVNGQTKPTPKTVPPPKTTTPPSTVTAPTTTALSTYSIRGAMSNGPMLKFTHLAVLDAHSKVISRWETDSLGLFKIKGLAKGRYRLVNSAIGIDTPFSVPKQSENVLIVNISVCNFGATKARKDIKAGKPMLLLSGGIAPVSSPKEDHFEKKYTVKYHDFGDTPPDIKCSMAYNKAVFAFLDKKFGKSWRKDARDDVIGLKR
ncbi:hypothetical protein [Mucilaginibacter sp. BT774]|uniref:FEKKY domain-containing protein n=1 Tax=Mucilaginibacter sp. BT774 TaxID=3062276 RepID=UPI002676C758|nr:hypothetical protein [Mucilaginibacter sp. BT774]MDO3624754.1 hypothetical protein [Mucilaginibacter sp. BT774]